MGSSVSKASKAAGSAARQYPKRPAPTSTTQHPTSNAPSQPPPAAANHQAGPTVHPQPQAAGARSEAINLDASDPDFARSLRSIGPVQPNPTLSPSSAFGQSSNRNAQASRQNAPDPRKNPAIMVLEARARLQDQADLEFINAGKTGNERQFLDAFTIREILVMRDAQGRTANQIEKHFGLKKGVVDRLGAPGVVGLVREVGRDKKEIDMV